MDAELNADIGVPKRRRKGVPWRRDLIVLRRLPEVEQRHLAGEYNTQIAEALGVDEATIRRDVERLRELWKERAGDTAETLRLKAMAELDDIKRRALKAAEWDQQCERAVLFDDLEDDEAKTEDGKPAKKSVYRDNKGSASFRGQKAQALNVARQAVMDKVRLLGLAREKEESGPDSEDPLRDLARAIDESLELLKGDGGV